VPPARKEEARILVHRTLASQSGLFRSAEIIVRINPLSGQWGGEDLEELSRCMPDAIILPKCESAADVERLASELDRLEATAETPRQHTLIMPLVESARGVLAAAAVATASPRVVALCFGAEDFAADIGARRTAAGTEALLARQTIVLAAKAAGAQALDSVFSDVEDAEGFVAYCAASHAMGFDGVGIVHPRQIPAANRFFSPTDEDLDHARQVVKALAEAEAGGSGVASYAGKMIDAPVARWARRIIDTASAEER
jgi:citrate lyase subunit beta/citryl-CoA lyase